MPYRLLYILMAATLLSACVDERERHVVSVMDTADSLMEQADRADSALAILNAVASEGEAWSTAVRMRHAMLTAKAQNKAYVDFTTDSVMRQVAEWYDAHGTPNEQMTAHYLLGCTYRDMGDAPIALASYYEAVEKADTLADDCDFYMLMRVWGQIAWLYSHQMMQEESIEAYRQFSRYAERAGDIYESIRGIEHQVGAYSAMGDTSNILSLTDSAFSLFVQNGFTKEANRVLPSKIGVLIDKKDFEGAKKLIDVFRNETGLFDEQGNIINSRSHCYYLFGRYYLGVNNLDSALHFFRKTIDAGYASDGYRGIMLVQQSLGNADSTLYYHSIYEDELGKEIAKLQIEENIRTRHMYDYTRQQNIAARKIAEAHKSRLLSIWLGMGLLAAILCMVVIVGAMRLKMMSVDARWQKLKVKYMMLQQEAARHNNTKFGETDNSHCTEQIQKIETAMTSEQRWRMQSENAMLTSTADKIRITLKTHATMSAECAGELEMLVAETFPNQYALMKKRNMSTTEMTVCCLLLLGYSNADMARLISKTPQAISNIRARLGKKIFDSEKEMSALEFDKRLRYM